MSAQIAPWATVAAVTGETTRYIPAAIGRHTVESLYAEHGAPRPWTYWLVLAGVIGAVVSLPLIKVDVSVRAAGLVRPTTERAELRPAVSGHIAEVLAHDNDRVSAGQPLLVLAARDLAERLSRNQAQQTEHADLAADLKFLTTETALEATDPLTAGSGSGAVAGPRRPAGSLQGGSVVGWSFRTPTLRQEHAQFLAQADSYRLAEAKARNELVRYTTLAGKGIATQQELDNARYEAERLHAESRLLVEQTLARWQSRLREEQVAQADLASEAQRLREEQTQYTLRAPAGGVLVGFSGWSTGGFVAAGQSLGAVSPEDTLQVEVYVSPRDIGLVRVGQTARLQIDAYPYTQWGTLDGTVTSISGDLATTGASQVGTVIPNGPSSSVAFKVLVRPTATFLALPNAVRGELKKGLTLSARFLVARRSVFQLLYDDVSAWLNPLDGRPVT